MPPSATPGYIKKIGSVGPKALKPKAHMGKNGERARRDSNPPARYGEASRPGAENDGL